jgi:hypothetical protein
MRPSRLVAKSSRRWLPWPKRIDIALLSYKALVIAYCDRVNISVAAPSMMREYAGMGWVLSGFFTGLCRDGWRRSAIWRSPPSRSGFQARG